MKEGKLLNKVDGVCPSNKCRKFNKFPSIHVQTYGKDEEEWGKNVYDEER